MGNCPVLRNSEKGNRSGLPPIPPNSRHGSHQELTKERGFSERTLDAKVDDPGLKKDDENGGRVGTHEPVVHERDA
ncbi:hypothetical protein TNCV_3021661 [Trichonephila clavipes]|nr:hypothetical protein TNCV_3021661 [Trichonephila clavipes]